MQPLGQSESLDAPSQRQESRRPKHDDWDLGHHVLAEPDVASHL